MTDNLTQLDFMFSYMRFGCQSAVELTSTLRAHQFIGIKLTSLHQILSMSKKREKNRNYIFKVLLLLITL